MNLETSIDFDSVEDFMDHLYEVNDRTRWIRKIPVTSLSVSAEDVTDNGKVERHIYVESEKGSYELRECGLHSLIARSSLQGEALEHMSAEDFAHVITTALKTRENMNAMMQIVDEKISAVLSDNDYKTNYSIMSSYEVIDQTQLAVMRMSTGEPVFMGEWDYSGIHAMWEMLDNEQEIRGKVYHTVLHVSNSDVGNGSVHFSMYLVDRDTVIPLCSDVRIEHRKLNDATDITKALDELEGASDKAIRQINYLESIIIQNPQGCLKRVMKRYFMPKRIALKKIDEYITRNGNAPASALTMYLLMTEVISEYCLSVSNLEYVEKKINDCNKALYCRWSEYDLPGDFAW